MKKYLVLMIGLLSAGFLVAQDNAPSSLAGKTAVVVISSGSGPFSPIGGYRIAFSATAATYTVSPLTYTVDPSAGTYTYTKTGANTGSVTVTDSSVGTAVAQTLVFSSPTTASFSISAFGGSQSGTIVLEGVTSTSVTAGDRLVNMSVRAQVPVGSNIIPGFVIDGARTKVLIRAGGPALAGFGVPGTLANPKFTVFRKTTPIAANDDWSSTAENRSAVVEAAKKTGAFPYVAGSKDAALVLDLDPDEYTAMISGAAGTGGEVLLEVYRVP